MDELGSFESFEEVVLDGVLGVSLPSKAQVVEADVREFEGEVGLAIFGKIDNFLLFRHY